MTQIFRGFPTTGAETLFILVLNKVLKIVVFINFKAHPEKFILKRRPEFRSALTNYELYRLLLDLDLTSLVDQ